MKNDTVTVSVIIPCYNCEEWIEKCISALENQTRKDFEVICVNDCSIDGTRDLLLRLKNSSSLDIKVIDNEINIGPAKSRNKAIKISSGSWLAFCDADDWFDSCFIEKMVSKAEATDSDIVMCEYKKVFESQKESIDVHYLQNIREDADIEEKIVYSKASLCLLLIKKELFQGLEIPDLRNGEDIAFIPCIESRASKIAVVKEPLYNYLMRGRSASNNIKSDKVYKSLQSAFSFTENNIEKGLDEALEFLGIRNVLYGVVLNALKVNTSNSKIRDIIDEFENKYPNWSSNKYLGILGKGKRLFLRCVEKKLLTLCRLFSVIHSRIST